MSRARRNTEDDERTSADVEAVQNQPQNHKPVDGENGRAKGQSYIKRLKEIYRAGPPDEGQRLWRGLRNYWREKQTGVVFEMCAPYRRDEASHVPSSESVVDREATDSPRHQSPIETSHIVGEDVEQCRPRRDSVVSYGDVSRTSREVPVKICQTILTLDANKPPPPPPRLSDAPRRRSQRTQNEIVDLDKPLPRTPFPCFPEPPKPWETSRESPVVPPWPPIHTATVGSELPDHYEEAPRQGNSTSSKRSKDVVQGPQPSTWLKNLATKVPNPQLNSPSKSKPTKADKAHDALKAKISRPIPISPTTIAVDFSPHRLPPQPDTMSEKARGKQRAPSSPTWLDKLAHAPLPILHTMPAMLQAKKRPGSDKSFQCQGTVAGHVCEECAPDLETGGRRGRQRARHGDGMRPEPLFTGGMFDGSYCDVEDANADHIRTGRWI
ncbi:hypothetical protein M3J09_011309 [Ascochyta lentis]